MHFRLALALLATIALGYWTRFHAPVPEWLRDASGGVFYVVAAAIALRAAGVKDPRKAAALAFLLTCALEFLQMWQAPWVVALRRTLPGRLILGTHFSWPDFPPYALGGLLSWLLLQSPLFNRRK